MTTVAVAWGRYLAEEHRAPIYALAGSGNFELLASFHSAGGEYVAAGHESGAVGMAAGWATLADEVGIASVHQGPGFTNALTALFDAAKGRVPLVLIVPDLGIRARTHHQWVDQRGLLEGADLPIAVTQVSQAANSLAELQHAIWTARSARQVQVMLLPIDMLHQEAGSPSLLTRATVTPEASMTNLARAVVEIQKARRPLIIAGRGALWSKAGPQLELLADRLQAPVATTAPVHGLFAESPWSIGIIGGFAASATAQAAREADLVLAVGTSLDNWTTAGGRLPDAGTPTVRIDDGPTADDGRHLVLRGDARETLEVLLGMLPDPLGGRSTWGRDSVARFLSDRADERIPNDGVHGLDPRALLARLNDVLPKERITCLDSGHFIALATTYLTRMSGPNVLFGQDFQSVGLGLFRAIGAAMARPDLLCVAILGDGGAGMSLLELHTAIDLELPILVVVMNDAAYGAEVHDFRPRGIPVAIAQFPLRNWAGLAKSMRAEGVIIHRLPDIDQILPWLASRRGPLLLDCRIDPDVSAMSVLTEEGRAEWAN